MTADLEPEIVGPCGGYEPEKPERESPNAAIGENIDILNAFQTEPPPLDFILPGFLAGTVGTMFSPGATGKSFLALETAMGIACSVAGGDLLNLKPQHTGPVVYFAAEDPSIILQHRIRAIGQRLPDSARTAIAERLTIQSVVGRRINIMNDSNLNALINYCSGVRVIIFDVLSRIHHLDENSNGEMGLLLQTLEYLAAQTGAAVLFLHHVSKSSARDGLVDQFSSRGASALTDNARFGMALSKMSEAESSELCDEGRAISERRQFYLRLSFPKINYSEPQPDLWFRREVGGVLVPAQIEKLGETSAAKNRRHDVNRSELSAMLPTQEQGGWKHGKIV
ncbi:MAG: helicase RepA family protein [Acidiferrobacteraceae bacterium]